MTHTISVFTSHEFACPFLPLDFNIPPGSSFALPRSVMPPHGPPTSAWCFLLTPLACPLTRGVPHQASKAPKQTEALWPPRLSTFKKPLIVLSGALISDYTTPTPTLSSPHPTSPDVVDFSEDRCAGCCGAQHSVGCPHCGSDVAVPGTV
jgi:hypothetical protein